jgi:hypothetical protein
MNPPSRLEIEKFANESFQAGLERRTDEYAQKQAQAIAQVMSRGNRAGYLLALIECKQERLRAEILTLADAWVEAGTTYAVPLPLEAEEAFEKTAAEMAAGTLSALRGELDLMTERIGLVSVPTDGVREIGKAMKSAVGEGRLRLKTQRVRAGHMAMQRFFQNLTVRAEPLEAASSNSPAVQLVHFPSQLPEARLEAVGLAPGLIGKLSKEALTRMQAQTTTFLEQYLPKLQRESNQNPIHDAELLKELVLHHYCLLGQECMAVCGSPDEFERQLWGEIAGSVRYALSKYPWLANGAMREELDSGFWFFIMRANPWADIAESDRGSTWHVGAITGEALSDLAMKLLTEDYGGEALSIAEAEQPLNQLVPPVAAPGIQRIFQKTGEIWSLQFNAKSVSVNHRIGIAYIAHLLRSPGHSISCLELQGAVNGNSGTIAMLGEEDKIELYTGDSVADEVLDQTARKQYKDRLDSIDKELVEAKRNNDTAHLERLTKEKQMLVDELKSKTGFAGRPRRFATGSERARKAVSSAIKNAMRNIKKYHPELAEHLMKHVELGLFCSYEGDGVT